MIERHRRLVDVKTRPWRCRASALAALSCLAMAAAPVLASGSEEDDLALAYGDKPYVSIATGTSLPLSRAPAIASVITADDIAATGATDLDQVLEAVPGLHVSRGTQAFSPLYVIRGINLGFNPQVLLLINGVPATSVYTGNRGNAWGGFPLDNVARVEIIRGPGSALYGAEAFAGVINVITKTASDTPGTRLGVRAGSFKTGDAWVLHGGQWGDVAVSAYLRVGTTDGARSTVKSDAQTGWDALTGTQASRAPGPISNGRDFVDAHLDLSMGEWRWRTGYRERDNIGSGTGIASALDPVGRSYSQNISTDLSHENLRLGDDWQGTVQLSWMHYKEFSDLMLLPPGANLGRGVFVDGMLGNPDKWERHGRLSASALYTGWPGHRVRLGLGVEREDTYKVRESKNFNPDLSPIGTGTRDDLVDVSLTAPFLRPQGRTKHHVYGQDEWQLAKDWTLTAGLRHDSYSDFGDTTNPRLAMVWEAAYNVTAKLLYGTAFRAPSLSELYAINNPVVIGNASLKPEKIRTLEAAVSWQPSKRLQLGLNVFRYRISDIIRLVDNVYQNAGGQNGHGLEFEGAWEISDGWRVSGNYSYQRSVEARTSRVTGLSPQHQLYARSDWQLPAGWALNAQLNWVGERARTAGDPRAPVGADTSLDLTLRSPSEGHWNVAMSVRNLLDADLREPSPYDRSAAQPFISLPGDIPLPGRAVYVEASLRF